ncbi:TetR/AcrR family transcriptional regulator [Curtobacterium sp. MCJR17_043]|uniref:TetR/AcrR family transcriptional regulator n=1 Tax=Curtobacterium sp. MCJR17_043 TaxID=2175660 RepID=UPI0024DFD6FD|nr:TetR/AcrR family transcriptional regulator [Curtobacterium sp. MCJR17_043]WIB35653.1 TetR family transcriptional regulator [Curtobacterium sp. MCJR17_043]
MSKDAAATRLALLQAARRRFALDGYRATTVRDIAADAGVNVALINRYFVSKEGLFRACLVRTRPTSTTPRPGPDLERAIGGLIRHIIRSPHRRGLDAAAAPAPELRGRSRRRHPSGDVAGGYADRLAGAVRPDGVVDEDLLVRAEIALSVVLGMTMLRTATRVEPLASAEVEAVAGPLEEALRALLGGRTVLTGPVPVRSRRVPSRRTPAGARRAGCTARPMTPRPADRCRAR